MRFKRIIIRFSNPSKYLLDFYQKLSITYSFFLQNELRNHAAAGAYYMLLSVIPLVLLLLYIFDTFLHNYPRFSQDVFIVLSMFNDHLSPQMFEQFGISKKAGSAIGAFGVLNLLLSSRLILSSVQRAFSVIFPAEKKRNFLLENAISLGVIPFVFTAVVIIGVLNSTRQLIIKYLQINGVSTYYIEPAINIMAYAIPAFLLFFVVFLTYRYLPIRKPSGRSAIKGTILFLSVFVIMKFVANTIFANLTANTAYGILGSLVVLMMWAYFVFLLFFFCAQYVFVTYRADILILNRLFNDEKPSNRFMVINKKILEKYTKLISKGEVLFYTGEESENVYYLLSGKLNAVIKGSVVGSIGPGEVFGEMAHITGEPRSADIAAEEDSELIVLPPAIFDEIMKDNADLARRLMHTLCDRLKKAQFMGRFSG